MSIDWVTLGAAFVTGAAGSLHCALMCGGIATSLGSATQPRAGVSGWTPAVSLNLARISGYVVAGVLVGALGAWIGVLLTYANLAWVMRGLLGLAMIAVALRMLGAGDRWNLLGRWSQAAWQHLAGLRRLFLPANTPWRRWGIGMLWGWLPCGLSSSVLLAAWLSASPLQGGLMMAGFGTGTLLTMVPLTHSGTRVLRRNGRSQRVAAATVFAAGLLVATAPWIPWHPSVAHGLRVLGCLP